MRQIHNPHIIAGETDKSCRQFGSKLPEGLEYGLRKRSFCFSTGFEDFDKLFPENGIPSGQLLEFTGSISCGKTSLVLKILSALSGMLKKSRLEVAGDLVPPWQDVTCRCHFTCQVTPRFRGSGPDTTAHGVFQHSLSDGLITYVDAGNMFFPESAISYGISPDRLLVLKPKSLSEAIRSTELVFKSGRSSLVVCDLVDSHGVVPASQFHRLRTQVVRSEGLLFFLTDIDARAIPPSMMSAQFTVTRETVTSTLVTVSKSRIMPVGKQTKVVLNE